MNTAYRKHCLILTSIIIAIALVLAGAFIFASPTAAYADTIDLYWDIDSDGVLTLSSGSGANNYYVSTWVDRKDEITQVKVVGTPHAPESLQHWFYRCTNLTTVDLSGLDTSDVTSMVGMFDGCDALTSLDLSSFDTQNVTDMNHMFYDCRRLESLNFAQFPNFNTESVTDMSGMFSGLIDLSTIDISNYIT